jgi:hypothetical protein
MLRRLRRILVHAKLLRPQEGTGHFHAGGLEECDYAGGGC